MAPTAFVQVNTSKTSFGHAASTVGRKVLPMPLGAAERRAIDARRSALSQEPLAKLEAPVTGVQISWKPVGVELKAKDLRC